MFSRCENADGRAGRLARFCAWIDLCKLGSALILSHFLTDVYFGRCKSKALMQKSLCISAYDSAAWQLGSLQRHPDLRQRPAA